MERIEDRIRDHLADNLHLVEPGLKLIQKEFPLESPIGAGGRVDILARDVCKQLVVLEIKRSDQAARQALHEVNKYIFLLRVSYGHDESRVRLIIVSTEWHELLGPLSEFAAISSYVVEGLELSISSTGKVRNVAKVDLLPPNRGFEISRSQSAYLFCTESARNAAVKTLHLATQAARLEDTIILRCDYAGDLNRVCFPFALYLCFSSPFLNAAPNQAERLKKEVAWDDALYEPESLFLEKVNTHMCGVCDDVEIGYPEKLTNIRAEWTVTVAKRTGRFLQNKTLLSDMDLLRMAQAVEGGSSIYINRISSPRFPAWARLRQDLTQVLQGNLEWQRLVPRLLDEVEPHSDRVVSVSVFNPANFLMTLYQGIRTNSFTTFPELEILVDDHRAGVMKVYQGFLVWNGKRLRTGVEELIARLYGSLEGCSGVN